MLRYFMKLRNRKGFTLTELIIVIAIIAILMACVAAFSGPIRQMVKSTAASTDALTANKIIGDYIENRLAFADSIDLFYAVDASEETAVNSTTQVTPGGQTLPGINEIFNAYKTRDVDDSTNNRDKSGVLILHYAENASEPEKSTYVLYDYPIKNSSSNYKTTVLDTINGGFAPGGEVFDEAFYTNSQNIIIAPTEIDYNYSRGTLNMAFDIIPYDVSEDYITRKGDGSLDDTKSQYVKSGTLNTYYEKLYSQKTNPQVIYDESYGLDDIKDQRSGAIERITFSLNNIRFADEKVINADGTVDYASSKFNWQAHKTDGFDGTDIVIFYHVPYYQ